MSAFDPKRTFLRPTPSRALAQIATITCLSLGGDDEAARFHNTRWWGGGLNAASAARAAAGADATGYAQAGSNGGLVVAPAPSTFDRRDLIIALAERWRMPAIYSYRFKLL
jgi:hypothetical protein